MSQTPFGVEQQILYFSTTAGGATPAVANQVGEFRGEPVINLTWANATWRGQDRFAKHSVRHDGDGSASIPGFTFDASEAITKFLNGTHTQATTLHGGSAAAREDKVAKNTKPLSGEWVIEGLNTADAKKFQIILHNAFLTGVNPTIGRTDFAATDLALTLLADASGDVVSFVNET